MHVAIFRKLYRLQVKSEHRTHCAILLVGCSSWILHTTGQLWFWHLWAFCVILLGGHTNHILHTTGWPPKNSIRPDTCEDSTGASRFKNMHKCCMTPWSPTSPWQSISLVLLCRKKVSLHSCLLKGTLPPWWRAHQGNVAGDLNLLVHMWLVKHRNNLAESMWVSSTVQQLRLLACDAPMSVSGG